MAFSMFTELCIHYHNQCENIFIILKGSSYSFTITSQSSICSSSGPTELLIYFLSLSTCLLVCGHLIQIFDPFDLILLLTCFQGSFVMQHAILHSFLLQNSILFYRYITFYRVGQKQVFSYEQMKQYLFLYHYLIIIFHVKN